MFARARVMLGESVLKRIVRCLSRDIGQPTHFTHPDLLKEDEVLPGMNKSEFITRRMSLMELIGSSHTGMTIDKHVVIILGAAVKYMSADVPYRFHQNTDMLYLSGFLEPDSVLVMESSGSLPQHKAVLYVKPRDPLRELWDGPVAGVEDALDFTGVDESYTLDELSHHLQTRYSKDGYCVWFSSDDSTTHPKNFDVILESLTRSQHSKIKGVYSPDRNIAQLRLLKSPSEQSLLRRAGTLAGHAFKAAMKESHGGVEEARLESTFEHSIKTGGAQWLSFPPVVAGGSRANCLHYIANNKTIKEGEMVLMDAGCEYHGYVSDVTRTWPVSGRFSPAQRDLYEIVRTTKEEITKLCRAGTTLNHLHSIANNIMESQLIGAGFLPHMSRSKMTQALNRLFPHHIGHYLGLDTHDTMTIDRNTILCPGMVVTVEPGLYIPDTLPLDMATPAMEELKGTGIRLEDDVLVTEGKAEILNKGCPDNIEEIEKLMRKE